MTKEVLKLSKVSVVLPIKNESKHIVQCIEQIFLQTYPLENLEILLIDGMSQDGTREQIQNIINNISNYYSGLTKHSLRLLDNPSGQRPAAMNIGIKAAQGDIILRIDARTIIPSDYIEKCVNALLETGADNAGGKQQPIIKFDNKSFLDDRALTQAAIALAFTHPFGVGNAQFRIGKKSGFVDTVYLGCFHKEIFAKVGLFDEESVAISEDTDMNYRILKAGGRVYFDKDIIAYYYPRDTLNDLRKLYFRYGGTKAGIFVKLGSLTAMRQLVAPLFIVALLLLPLLGLMSQWFWFVWLGVCGLYLFLDILFALHLALQDTPIKIGPDLRDYVLKKKEKIKVFLRLILVFPIMHLAWGLGFWRRVLQKPKPGEYWGY